MRATDVPPQSENPRDAWIGLSRKGGSRASVFGGRWLPLLAAIAFAFAAILPGLYLGNPSGHDFEFHLASWAEAAQQWHQGIVYPRWALGGQFGYGEPRFIFYPPFSWVLGAALGSLLPWTAVPGAFAWLTLTLAGIAAYRLVREWQPQSVALWAAALYVTNPYNLVNLYLRSAFAELLASAFFPLAVLYALRLARPGKENAVRGIVPLALVVAAVWLSNVPAAVVTCYAVALLMGIEAVRQKSLVPVLRCGIAGVLGFALCGFYVVPATYEQRWIHAAEAFAGGLDFQMNFLFGHTGDADHDAFNRLVSTVAAVELALAAIIFAACWRFARRPTDEIIAGRTQIIREALLPILCLGIFAGLLPFRASLPVWKTMPFLKYVQFPWRSLFALNAAIVFAAACLAPNRRWRHAGKILTLAVWIVLAGIILSLPQWEGTDVQEYAGAVESGKGYESIAEYVTSDADGDQLLPGAPQVALADPDSPPENFHFTVEKWRAEERLISLESSEPVRLQVRLVDYPAWQVEVNGNPGGKESNPDTGQLIISVPAGRSQVRIFFVRTQDRVAGAIVSCAAGAVLIGMLLLPGARRK